MSTKSLLYFALALTTILCINAVMSKPAEDKKSKQPTPRPTAMTGSQAAATNTSRDDQEEKDEQEQQDEPFEPDLDLLSECERLNVDEFVGLEGDYVPINGTNSNATEASLNSTDLAKENNRVKRSFFHGIEEFFADVLEFFSPISDFVAGLLGYEPKPAEKLKQKVSKARYSPLTLENFQGTNVTLQLTDNIKVCIFPNGKTVVIEDPPQNPQTKPENSTRVSPWKGPSTKPLEKAQNTRSNLSGITSFI